MSDNSKTLNAKPKTLGLSQRAPLGANIGKPAVAKHQPGVVAKGKVVVVTKARGKSQTALEKDRDDNLTDAEYLNRIQVLKQAELAKDQVNHKKEEQNKEEGIAVTNHVENTDSTISNEPNTLEVSKSQEQLEQLIESKASEPTQNEVKSDPIITPLASQKVLTPSAKSTLSIKTSESGDNKSRHVKQHEIKKISLDEVLAKNKVRNLDNIYRVRRPQDEPSTATITESEEVNAKTDKDVKYDRKTQVVQKKSIEEEREVSIKKQVLPSAKNKISVAKVLMMDGDEEDTDGVALMRRRSMASIMRAKEKARRKISETNKVLEKVVREVNIPDFISVQDLANRMAEKTADVVKSLMKLGMIVSASQLIDADTSELIVTEFGHKVKRVTEADLESALIANVNDKVEQLITRPPVVTIMGHVDHGKTSLLDALRLTDVAAKEAGGITQHIGAYQITTPQDKVITFLDTPGHEAFTAMRMRGAKATDIVVLVVAADDGIMQQTVEAINHAKAANVPIIVAINKIDKPEADIQRVKNELLIHSLVPDDMGGDVMVVPVSAKQRSNLDKLEEAVLLQAEMLALKANPDRLATGVVVEAKVVKGQGIVATLLVQNGALKVGDVIVAGSTYGKVKLLHNDHGVSISSATPATPVEVLGLEDTPVAGDEFVVVANEKTARDIVSMRVDREKKKRSVAKKSITLEQLFKNTGVNGVKALPVIIKADVHGSVEAISQSLNKLASEEVEVRILHAGVGGINESDISLAIASSALVIGFNVRANQQARELAKTNCIDIKYYEIIYNLVDEIKAAMSGMLSPVMRENIMGYVDVREVFDLSKYGKIAGCYVTDGSVKRTASIRIIRDSVVIFNGKLKALKRFKEDVKEVSSGFECGMSFENYEDIRVGDKIEVYELVEQSSF